MTYVKKKTIKYLNILESIWSENYYIFVKEYFYLYLKDIIQAKSKTSP